MAEDHKKLLAQAESDLNAARNSLAFQSYDESIASCYMALDKALHALCAFHHITAPPESSSIERLCEKTGFKPSDPAAMEMMEKAYSEKPETIARDYAGERIFSAGEAAQALRFATETLGSIRKRLKL